MATAIPAPSVLPDAQTVPLVLRGDAPVLSRTQGAATPGATAASSAVLLVRRRDGQRAVQRAHVRRAVTR